jgi:O-antigen ligase/polysaccharide polymerase Wzy-like membrane protein/tetratricopeptide repeat protein
VLRVAATAALTGGALIATSAAGGAYFPQSWGWSGLVFCGALALVLLLASSIALSRLELVFLGALAAFVAWVAVSAIWSESVTRTVLEIERDLVYVVAAVALLTLAPRFSTSAILGAVAVAAVVVCAWSLTTRESDGNRLIGPVGYWNALGLVCAIGTIVALGFAVEGNHRSIAAAACVPFVATLYLTYSRGSLIALAAGLAVALALTPERVRLLVTGALLAAPCLVGVLVATRTTGVRLRLALAVLALVAAAAPDLADRVAARIRVGARFRRAAVPAALGLAVLVVAVGLAVSGGLGASASRAYRSFSGAPPTGSGHARLLSISGAGRIEYWQVAWRDFKHHPLAGSGAGTFALVWDRDRHTIYNALDAHSLYVEVLGELGPLGLLLAAVALGIPLLALRRSRGRPFAAIAAGAYVAFVLHAGMDWDWEVPAVTLAGLACGCALLVGAREERALELSLPVRAVALGATVLVAAFVAVTYDGNIHVARGTQAYDAGVYGAAIDEAKRAASVLRWSADPWELRGDAERAAGQRDAARRSYRRALDLDPNDWRLWYDLGVTSRGPERREALARATRLNPLAREILGLHDR